MSGKTLIVSFMCLAGLAACVDISQFETEPVEIMTSMGTVTCQLYSSSSTSFDRAIGMPTGMTIIQADEICRQRGLQGH